MELRITNDAKAAISLELTLAESPLTEAPFLEIWGVHVFRHERGDFLLLTEGKSFFSIITSFDLNMTRRSFELNFRVSVARALSALIDGPLPQYFEMSELRYAKTRNDGLRRAQTDQIWRAQNLLDEGRNTFAINRIPYKSLDYRFPVDLFIQGVSERMKSNGDQRVFVPNDLGVN